MSNENISIKKEQHKEQNIKFANLIADILNNLINENVLSSNVVSNASNETIEEFIVRFRNQLEEGTFNATQKEKIKSLFGEQKNALDSLKRQEIIDNLRQFLKALQETKIKTPITGLLVFGSRMDPDKTPRLDSDIDISFFALPKTGETRIQNQLLWQIPEYINEIAKKHPELVPHKLGSFETIAIDIFIEQLQNPENTKIESLFWTWKPKSVYFIGKARGYSETQVNALIKKYLNSKELKKIQEEELRLIREKLLSKTISL